MAQQTEARRKSVFDKALSAAKEIAVAEGLSGLTARRIAKASGCSVGTLYNVFGNLDTLILHLNASTLERLNELLAQPSSGKDPEHRVRELSERYMQFTSEYANLWSVLFEHVWPRDQAMPNWYPVRIRRLLGVLAGAMAPLFPDGSEQERLQAAAVLWSSLHGIHSLAASGKMGLISSESVTAMTEVLIHNFVAGLSQRAAGLAQS
jgi:AcrR family transcriptional regulator